MNMGQSRNIQEMMQRITEQEDMIAKISAQDGQEMSNENKALLLRNIVTSTIDDELEKRQDIAEDHKKIRDYVIALGNSD